MKGITKAKTVSIDAARVKELAASGMGGTAIARELNVSRASVYRLLNTEGRSIHASLESESTVTV